MKKHITYIVVIIVSFMASVAWGASPAFENFKPGVFSRSGNTIQIADGATNAAGKTLATTDGNITGNAATATAASLVTGNGSINSTNFTGNAAGLTNLYWEIPSRATGEMDSWPYKYLNPSNTPASLLMRPAQMSGGAEQNFASPTAKWAGVSPRGVSTWNVFGTNFNGASLTNLILKMSTNGMARHGYNWLGIDEAYGPSYAAAGVPAVPYSVAFPDGVLRWDTNRFPQGGKAIVDFARSKGIHVLLYTRGDAAGSAGYYCFTSSNKADVVTSISNAINYLGISGIKYETGRDGNAQFIANEIAKWGKPIWLEIATQVDTETGRTYAPWMADAVNGWRPGVAVYGDLSGLPSRLYGWQSLANLSMTRPGHVISFDMLGSTPPSYMGINSPEIGGGGLTTKHTGNLNILAMMAMANSPIWLAGVPNWEGYSTRYKAFYEDYNNPLINSIQADFTKPAWLQSSNYLAVTFAKWLRDGSLAVLVQNQSNTNKSETINFSDYFGNHHATMSQSTNAVICTVRDIVRNVTLGRYTNSYTAPVAETNIVWLQLYKGSYEQYAPGTNYISDYSWNYMTNWPDNDPGVTVNYTYWPFSDNVFINSTRYAKGYYISAGSYTKMQYPLHKQADFFSATVWNRFNGGGSTVNIYTNLSGGAETLALTVPMGISGSVSNIFVGLTNADWMAIEVIGTNSAAAYTIASPLIYCRGRKTTDEQGREMKMLDENYVATAFGQVASAMLSGSGVNVTNIGDDVIYFDSIPMTGFSRLSETTPSDSPSAMFAGFSGTGAATRRACIYVPGWVTNAVFSGMVVQANAISTWTNEIAPLFQASDGRRVISPSGGMPVVHDPITISAANAASNYSFTVTWPATNVSVKGVQWSFLTATNTTATHFIGPMIRVRYNP